MIAYGLVDASFAKSVQMGPRNGPATSLIFGGVRATARRVRAACSASDVVAFLGRGGMISEKQNLGIVFKIQKIKV
jgi:hypothetical protein